MPRRVPGSEAQRFNLTEPTAAPRSCSAALGPTGRAVSVPFLPSVWEAMEAPSVAGVRRSNGSVLKLTFPGDYGNCPC